MNVTNKLQLAPVAPVPPESTEVVDSMRPVRKSVKLADVCYDIRGPVLARAKQMEDEGHRIIKLNIGNLAPFEPAGRGGQRMHPETRFAALGDIGDPAGQIERRRLVGHQRRAGDAAKVKGGLVGGEDTQIDCPVRHQ